MEIAFNNRMMPVFDANVEYIQSTGSQRITIPLDISYVNKVIVRATANLGTNRSLAFDRNLFRFGRSYGGSVAGGSRGAAGMMIFAGAAGSAQQPCTYPTNNTEMYNFEWGFQKYPNMFWLVNYDGSRFEYSLPTVNFSQSNILDLFYGTESETVKEPIDAKLKCLDIIVDGSLACQLRAVRKYNVGYLHDKVSGKLFSNNMNGKFILGPDENQTK